MTKKIFICTDGTWNTTYQTDRGVLAPSNVAIMARMLLTLPEQQLVYYDRGVGTRHFLDKITGGAFGHGLYENVQQAYQFLVEHYQTGDEVILFGFSRGAFTARSLAGMICKMGILRKKYIADIRSIYDYYRDQNADEAIIRQYSENFCHPPNGIQFLGVWDTVGALGIPLKSLNWLTSWRYKFHNTSLSPHVKHAFHALALDEKRRSFIPTLWKKQNLSAEQVVEQRWFAGVHSNIGGGYADKGLSDITLSWMLEMLSTHVDDIQLDKEYIKEHLNAEPCGEMRESRSAYYFISWLFPYLRQPNNPEMANQIIDNSVYSRMQDCPESQYQPENLS